MAFRFDFAVLRDETRKIGVGLVIAGVIGTIVEDVPVGAGVAAIIIGVALIIVGAAVRRSNHD
ncbi:MAG: hypothetical protein H0V62_11575 [Gammaproteobacteria bacterium]|nr:hypothetical protein [Gammaproteobacteria bacterium]